MNTVEGIIKDVENGELVSKNVLSRVIELIGLEKWQAINDEHGDIITTTGELLIILKNLVEAEDKHIINADIEELADKSYKKHVCEYGFTMLMDSVMPYKVGFKDGYMEAMI